MSNVIGLWILRDSISRRAHAISCMLLFWTWFDVWSPGQYVCCMNIKITLSLVHVFILIGKHNFSCAAHARLMLKLKPMRTPKPTPMLTHIPKFKRKHSHQTNPKHVPKLKFKVSTPKPVRSSVTKPKPKPKLKPRICLAQAQSPAKSQDQA